MTPAADGPSGEIDAAGELDARAGRSTAETVGRALGRAAGRTKRAVERLGRSGARSVALRGLRRERERLLRELGALARGALSKPEGNLRAGDPGTAALLHALDRADEEIERLLAEAEDDQARPPRRHRHHAAISSRYHVL